MRVLYVYCHPLADSFHAGNLVVRQSNLRDQSSGASCSFRIAKDGVLRCLPSHLTTGIMFSDDQCTQPLAVGDEDCEPVFTPTGAAPLLAEAGDRPGKPDRDHAVEQADVDPELQRVRRADPEQLARHEPLLDFPALGRRIAGSVRRERGRVDHHPRACGTVLQRRRPVLR